jgi:S-DNA-T family DNA segregation ATPase FtsK/SpoIIIE
MLSVMDHCDECGFTYERLAIAEAPSALRLGGERLAEDLFSGDDASIHSRPDPSTWSVIEYSCHVRDVLLVQRERILLALVEETPRFVPMYREQRVAAAGYHTESATEVSQELSVVTNLVAKVVAVLDSRQLARTCVYNVPEPRVRNLAWVVRRSVHEVVHHEMDVRRVRTQLMDGDVWT